MHIVSPRVALAALLVALAVPYAPALAADPAPAPVISRDILFGNPEKVSPKLSPDGKKLAWIAPDEKNVLQVWVKTVGQEDDKKVTADKKRGIRQLLLGAGQPHPPLPAGHRRRRELPPLRRRPRLRATSATCTPFQGVRASPPAVEPERARTASSSR